MFMFLKTLLLTISASIHAQARASEFYGFQTLSIINLKDNVKCSAILLNTNQGCVAVTNSHCIKGLAIGEENIIISSTTNPELVTTAGREILNKLNFTSTTEYRSHLIKAKPSSDIAQIYFDPKWAPRFCEDKYKITLDNSPRHGHINEVYSTEDQNKPGQLNQQIPGELGQSRAPNPTIYYKPSQNFCLIASGFQNDKPTLLSLAPIDYDSIGNPNECPELSSQDTHQTIPMKTRLNVEYSSLPGMEYVYQVRGINLSQGMSGGALFSIEDHNIALKAMSASFYPFQWVSNFIPISYILDFLQNYVDDNSDNFEIKLNIGNVQIASDSQSAKIDRIIEILKKEGKLPDIIKPPKKPFEIRSSSKPARIPRTKNSFGDTDQDDVGDEDNLSCNFIPNKVDPIFDIIPPVTNCFDLSQSRFKHSGVITSEDKNLVIIGYQDKQINGLSDLREVQQLQNYNPNDLIKRRISDYPSQDLRKSILDDLQGIFHEQSNAILMHPDVNMYNHLNESFTRQYTIKSSGNALLNESIINSQNIADLTFENLYNYKITSNLHKSHAIKTQLKIDSKKINLYVKLINNQNLVFDMTPVFTFDHKKIHLKTELRVLSDSFDEITKMNFTLNCDNRNFLKLICFNDILEFSISMKQKNSHNPILRLAFWEGFKTKSEALENKNFNMTYLFGELIKKYSITRNTEYSSYFSKKRLEDLLDSKNYQSLNIHSLEVIDRIVQIPRKIKSVLNCNVNHLSTKSFIHDNELFHIVHSQNDLCQKKKPYGVIFDRSYNVVGIILKGKVSTDAKDIF